MLIVVVCPNSFLCLTLSPVQHMGMIGNGWSAHKKSEGARGDGKSAFIYPPVLLRNNLPQLLAYWVLPLQVYISSKYFCPLGVTRGVALCMLP